MLERNIKNKEVPTFGIDIVPTFTQRYNINTDKVAAIAVPLEGPPYILCSGLPSTLQKITPKERHQEINNLMPLKVHRVDLYGFAPMIGFQVGDGSLPLGSVEVPGAKIKVFGLEVYRYDQQKNTFFLEIHCKLRSVEEEHILWLEMPGDISKWDKYTTTYITFLESMTMPCDTQEFIEAILKNLFGTAGRWYGKEGTQVHQRWVSFKKWLDTVQKDMAPSPLAVYLSALLWFSDQKHTKGISERSLYINCVEYNKQREFKSLHSKILSKPFINKCLIF